MKFSKDLRDLDEKEFREVYSYLEKETNGFTEVDPELILENQQYLLVFRLCLGVSQKQFDKKINAGKYWCRHTESKRNKIINETVAKRYNKKIENLLKNHEINLEKTLECWKRYTVSRNCFLSETIKMRFNSISRISDEQLKELYEITKKETKDFTKFNPMLISEIPQTLLIFRIIFREDHKKFAKRVGVSERSYRRYECLEGRLRSETAKKITKHLLKTFSNKKIRDIGFDQLLENKRVLTNFFGHRNLEAMIEQGLKVLAKIPQTDFEKEVASLLEKHSIPFENCGIVAGIKRRYNIDFVIPDTKNPKIVIEVFRHTMGGKSRNTKSKVRSIDHRFQSIKLKNPKMRTITIMKLTGKAVLLDLIKKDLNREILNTDTMLINQEIQNLPDLLKEAL
jgi:hypothetical protein